MWRPAVARRLTRPQTIRPLSTLPSSSDADTLQSTFAALESIIPGANEALQPPLPPIPPTPSVDTHEILDIPPAEDPLLHYVTSSLTKHGHRARAAKITARTLLHIHALTRAPPLPIFREAIFMAAPAVRCMTHRHGTKNIVKPVSLGEKQRTRYAVGWILDASEKKMGKTVEERLAREMVAVVRGESEALRKKEEIHRFAMVNRGNMPSRM